MLYHMSYMIERNVVCCAVDFTEKYWAPPSGVNFMFGQSTCAFVELHIHIYKLIFAKKKF